ncbi:MAG: hypothetical protein JNK26_05015 [Candidatus Doudnabacteria bacterium]|nr:hypothetical protein [Candidatus Doudnabacteria bacterium]
MTAINTTHENASFKENTGALHLEDLIQEVTEIGELAECKVNQENGAVSLTIRIQERGEYLILVPASKWRRNIVRDEHGAILEVRHREPEDLFLMLGEAQVIALDRNRQEFDLTYEKDLADKHLETAVEDDGVRCGSEQEYTLDNVGSAVGFETALFQKRLLAFQAASKVPDVTLTLVGNPAFWDSSWRQYVSRMDVGGMKELGIQQREHNGNVSAGSLENAARAAANLRFALESLRPGLFVNAASTHPHMIEMDPTHGSITAQDNPETGPYVENVINGLHNTWVLPYLNYIPQEVFSVWAGIAANYGFENLFEFIQANKDMKYWLMNSVHNSIDLPVDERGYTSVNLARSTANLYTYFRNVMNALCYSGGDIFNYSATLADGEPVSDARELARMIMPTSMPANLTRPDVDLLGRMENFMMNGMANNADRAGCETEHPVTGELPQLHGDVRLRVSYPWAAFKADVLNNQPMGSSVRIEYTSRPTTPDMNPVSGKLVQSFAIQEVLSYAALLATSEGHQDIFEWLKANNLLVPDRDIYAEHTSEYLYQEMLQCLKGKFSSGSIRFKLNLLIAIIDLVERKYVDFSSNAGKLSELFIIARKGVETLKRTEQLVDALHRTDSPVDKYNLYLRAEAGNWGEFMKALSEEDIRVILSEIFEYPTENLQSLVRGDLVLILNHEFLKSQITISES